MWNLILLVAGFLFTRPSKEKEKREGTGVKSETWDKLTVAIIAVVAYYILKGTFSKFTTEKTYENASGNVSIQQAIAIRQALNPSGSDWLIAVDGSDEDALFNLAPLITNWADVQSSYYKLYSEYLVDRLQKDLSNAEYVKFTTLIGSKPGTTPTTTTPTPTTPAPTTSPTAGTANKYNYKNLPAIGGKKVIVNRLVAPVTALNTFNMTNNVLAKTVSSGENLGKALGWAYRQGVTCVVYEVSEWIFIAAAPFIINSTVERYVNANYVRTE